MFDTFVESYSIVRLTCLPLQLDSIVLKGKTRNTRWIVFSIAMTSEAATKKSIRHHHEPVLCADMHLTCGVM